MVNLQHDCHRGQCSADGQQTLHQEREAISRTRKVTKHTDDEHYVVNIQSLHNYKSIANALPANLRKSAFHVEDQLGLRHTAAKGIREKKLQDLQGKEHVPASDVQPRLATDVAAENSGSQCVVPLNDDGDLNVLPGVLGHAAPVAPTSESQGLVDSEAGPVGSSSSNALASGEVSEALVDATINEPIFSTSNKGKGKAVLRSKGRKIASDMCVTFACSVDPRLKFPSKLGLYSRSPSTVLPRTIIGSRAQKRLY